MKGKQVLTLALVAVMLLSACSVKQVPPPTTQGEASVPQTTSPPATAPTTATTSGNALLAVRRYDDIRYFSNWSEAKGIYEADEFNPADIITLTFNEGTVLKGSEELQAQIMEAGKNPGLGVRALHEQGITGQGVNVAIIDQNLLLNHPEFAGKIAAYYDTGCEIPEGNGSMHGPGVTSLLVGESIGVAPGARVYYAAAPSWTGDSEYYAKGLYWIIEENEKLSQGEKIRVVSVSAAPSGEYSLFSANQEMWDEAVRVAKEAGIYIIDCRDNIATGFVGPAYYDPVNPEEVARCRSGFPNGGGNSTTWEIYAPASYRTVAEEYVEGQPSYQYNGVGGLSWAIPYVAGVMALGWQVNPELDGVQMRRLLRDTTAEGKNGKPIIDPVAFIEAVTATLD